MAKERVYACIDLKSFYASVECVERGLDPFTTNLVVADYTRGDGGITLAISPAMKDLGVKNRCRVFEIPKGIEYITAMPRMKKYMDYSAEIYATYLKYISQDDIHVYSIDECFFDLTDYLTLYNKSAMEIAEMLMNAVYEKTHICATAGVGTNLYLAKIAMDITAKHITSHIAYLDEEKYKKTLWHHRPITDFWNVGHGIAKRLERYGIYDMCDVAHTKEDILYREFGVNAEFLIDHSKGIEPCTIADIHNYHSKTTSMSNGQILFKDYCYEDAKLVMKEMVDNLTLDLVAQGLVTDSISLYIGYSKDVVKSTGGTRKLGCYTSSYKKLVVAFVKFLEESAHRDIPIRRISIGFNRVTADGFEQFDLFTAPDKSEREEKMQKTILNIKEKYGKNAVFRGMSLQENATQRMRNGLIGGHKSGEEEQPL